MAALARLTASSLRLPHRLLQPCVVRVAGISTSKKNKDTVAVTDVITEHAKPKTEAPVNQNWVSWGFGVESQEEDNTHMHLVFFYGITLCIVTLGYIWSYLPDHRMKDWAQREAFLELRRREALGLPRVDPNLVPVDTLELPSDEELGNREIII